MQKFLLPEKPSGCQAGRWEQRRILVRTGSLSQRGRLAGQFADSSLRWLMGDMSMEEEGSSAFQVLWVPSSGESRAANRCWWGSRRPQHSRLISPWGLLFIPGSITHRLSTSWPCSCNGLKKEVLTERWRKQSSVGHLSPIWFWLEILVKNMRRQEVIEIRNQMCGFIWV